jgi:myo-inositol 2-dehydrogenase / D-chiro-inositol 1-dehydrogenase
MYPNSTRRDFLRATQAAGLGLLVLDPTTLRGSEANSALTIGLVGCGRRGMFDAAYFAQNKDAEVVAVCDIYDDMLDGAKKQFPKAAAYRSYEELLTSDIDAVLLATPPHLRPEQFEAAVQARKHVFMEKPVAVDVAGCRRMLAAAHRADPTKRISVDFQQRYGKDYRTARRIVRSGQIGDIQMIRGAWMAGDLPLRTGHPEAEEKMRNWLFYREYSGDIVVEQDCHNLDVANWFMGATPLSAVGYGGRRRRTYGDILDSLAVNFEYPNGVVLSYSANQFSKRGFRDIGETFIGDEGAISTSRQGYRWFNKIVDENLPAKGYKDASSDEAPDVVMTENDITEDAVNEFVAGARTGKIENAAFHAVEAMYTAIMARTAIYTGREVTWEKMVASG